MTLTPHQLKLRKRHLGASETPVVLGLSPYSRSAADLYWSKVAEVDDEPTEAMSRGHWMEDVLVSWASEQLGVAVVSNQFRVLHTGLGKEILSATHDAVSPDKPIGIEAKSVSRFNPAYGEWGEEGTDEIPADVVIQCQQQMLVSDLDVVWVPVAFEAKTLERRLYRVPRDDELIEMFRVPAVAWWRQYVESRIVPGDDPTPPLAVLKRIHRVEGSVVELEPGVAELIKSLNETKAESKETASREASLKARIIEALGDAEAGKLPDGRLVTYCEQKSSPKVDLAHLKLHHPALYAEIVCQGTHRTLRITKGKKGD